MPMAGHSLSIQGTNMMDPQIKLLAAIKREITKIVGKGYKKEDKLMLIDFGERRLAELRAEIEGEGKSSTSFGPE